MPQKKPAKQHESDGERSKNLSPTKSPKTHDQSSPSTLVKSISLTNPDGRSSAQKKLAMDSSMETRSAENVNGGSV